MVQICPDKSTSLPLLPRRPDIVQHKNLMATKETRMRIIVLFNLRKDVAAEAYETWAKANDMPTVRGLPSVTGFEVAAATGLLGSDAPPPYQYIEVIDVADMDQFGEDIGTEAMQRIAAEFQTFADGPIFITTRNLDA